MPDVDTSLSKDLLKGTQAIADFLDMPRFRVEYFIRNNLIPFTRIGSSIYGSKSKLRAHFLGEGEKKPEPAAPEAAPEPVRVRRKRPSLPRLKSEGGNIPRRKLTPLLEVAEEGAA
jgi:hypothetical protein